MTLDTSSMLLIASIRCF